MNIWTTVWCLLFIDSQCVYICYRHIVKPGITRNAWKFQALREITNSLSHSMKWLKSLGISRNDWNFDVHITLSAWTGLDNKRNELESAVITSRSGTINSQPVSERLLSCWDKAHPIHCHVWHRTQSWPDFIIHTSGNHPGSRLKMTCLQLLVFLWWTGAWGTLASSSTRTKTTSTPLPQDMASCLIHTNWLHSLPSTVAEGHVCH